VCVVLATPPSSHIHFLHFPPLPSLLSPLPALPPSLLCFANPIHPNHTKVISPSKKESRRLGRVCVPTPLSLSPFPVLVVVQQIQKQRGSNTEYPEQDVRDGAVSGSTKKKSNRIKNKTKPDASRPTYNRNPKHKPLTCRHQVSEVLSKLSRRTVTSPPFYLESSLPQPLLKPPPSLWLATPPLSPPA